MNWLGYLAAVTGVGCGIMGYIDFAGGHCLSFGLMCACVVINTRTAVDNYRMFKNKT